MCVCKRLCACISVLCAEVHLDGGRRILVQQCFEFGAVNCQKKLGIFIRINITITIYYT